MTDQTIQTPRFHFQLLGNDQVLEPADYNYLLQTLDANLPGSDANVVANSVHSAALVSTTAPSTYRNVIGKTSATFAGAVTVDGGNGSLVGTRGEFAVGNAATVLGAGYYYGTQGKLTAVAGATVGAGAHVFGLVGQFDLSLGHVTGDPQISAVWGDMGATAPTDGWGANSSLLSGQNTTLKKTNSHIYTYGMADYWTDIESNAGAGASSIVASTTGALTPTGAAVKLKVRINGADYYILAAAGYS